MSWDGSKVRRLANQVLGRYGSTCWLCGKPIDLTASRRSPLGLTVDHVVPRSKGGTDDITNLRPAHHHCNTSRQARPASIYQPPRSWSGSGTWPGLTAPANPCS